MTIQREYSLPNCKLVVEGFAAEGTETSARPQLAIITQVECNLAGHEPPLSGGRSLLDALVQVVSHYAQECLSGIPHPHRMQGSPTRDKNGQAPTEQTQVRFERLESDIHRLVVSGLESVHDGAEAAAQGTRQIDLQTVQLFDLVEALDQLLADQQTLPDLTLSLAPVSRQYAVTHEPISRRVVPAAVGLASVAVAAIALFFLPIPQRQEPEPSAQESPAATTSPNASTSPEPPGVPSSPSPSPEAATPSPEAVTPSPEATPSETPEASPSATPDASPSPEASASPGLNQALNSPDIEDPATIAQLQSQLRDRLDGAWSDRPELPEDLVYRVRVAANGDILGFRYMNDAAVEHMDDTPLRDLQYNRTGDLSQEATTEFRVVFTQNQVIQVSPWYGRPTP